MSHKICNKTPWKSLECGRPGFVACISKPGSCKNRNLTYVIQCTECLTKGTIAKYHEETHRTMWDRCRDHINALEKQDKSYAPAEHWENEHPESKTPPSFTFKVSKICKSSLERQMWEGLEIEYSDTQVTLNRKG